MAVYVNPNAGAQSERYGERTITNQSVTATKAYQGILGQGDITIDLAQSNTTGNIRKPLIVVEGFDPDGSFDYEEELIPDINFDMNFGGVFFHIQLPLIRV